LKPAIFGETVKPKAEALGYLEEALGYLEAIAKAKTMAR